MESDEQLKTQKIIQPYLNDYENIKYIIHKTNKNGSCARNTGIKNSVGEYICFLDDDDEFLPTKIEKQLNIFLKKPNVGLTFSSVCEKYADFSIVHNVGEHNDLFKDYLIHNIFISSSSVMIKKNVIENIGPWDETFSRHQDYEFIARVLSKYNAIGIDEVLVNKFRVDANLPKKAKEVEKYRMHYQNKMLSLFNSLDVETKREFIFMNAFAIGISYLKNKKYFGYIKWSFISKNPFRFYWKSITAFIVSKKRRKL